MSDEYQTDNQATQTIQVTTDASSPISENAWRRIEQKMIAAMRSSPIAESTPAWNHFIASMPKFKTIINVELGAKAD